MKKLVLLFVLALAIIAGCKKYDFDKTVKGEALGDFKITAPGTNIDLVLNAATPGSEINITWTAATPGVNTAPAYTWVAALKTGNIDNPLINIPSNNAGKDTKLTLTHAQIDEALAAKGIAEGAVADLVWSVVADNGSIKVRSTDVFSIKITRFDGGVTPFDIYGPLSSTNNVELDPASNSE
ncbi:MAG: SusE domain-containing protein [Chitinophagaceae bacterium]|nr:SusE domain-containing protein [Chitinophagaceae bacterium]